MRPRLSQRLIANGWWTCAVLTVGTLAGTSAIVAATWRGATASVGSFVLFLFVVAFGALTSFALSAFPLLPTVAAPVLAFQAWRNGAPFAIGDRVRVLGGPHRGLVTRIHACWPTRRQVRIDLGEDARRKVTDVVSEWQVCRVADDNG